MDFDTLRRARRLGASDKGRQFNVGFRGIGISGAPSVSPQPDIAPPVRLSLVASSSPRTSTTR